MALNVLIVDDHEIIMKGFATIFNVKIPRINMRYTSSGIQALELLSNLEFDVVILDIRIPRTDVFLLIEKIFEIFPHMKIICFTMCPESIYAKRMYAAGVKGYVSKESSSDEILKAIRIVNSGKIYFSDSYQEMIAQRLIQSDILNPFELLSNRELQITTMLVNGCGLMEIERTLHIHKSTVSTFKTRIFDKLDVTNLIELYELCLGHGMA